MIAIIRVHEDGHSRHLCNLDLLKFSEEQVRERMRERGISDDAFFVCGFEDWGIDYIMDLSEAYIVKKQLLEVYGGDDYVLRHLLRYHSPVSVISSGHYQFVSKDELTTMLTLIPEADTAQLLTAFQKSGSWVNFMMGYVNAGYLLNTPKGFYIRYDV